QAAAPAAPPPPDRHPGSNDGPVRPVGDCPASFQKLKRYPVMSSSPSPCRSNPRFVGDPIDVVTGANTDTPVDLAQRGPILFQWVRYYSSARSRTRCSLGWGHSHDFDRLLHRDLDGLRYEDPLGGTVDFQDLPVGADDLAGGMPLTRIAEQSYCLLQ